MRIACPNCQTLYDVPDNLLGGRPRRLRCEQCGHGWRVMPEGQEEAASAPPPAPLVEDSPGLPALVVGEALNRRFGEPVDDAAKAEMQAALQDEAQGTPHHDHEPPPHAADEAAEPDRFADLVRAARNNEMELEPYKPAKKRGRQGNPRLMGALVVVLVLLLIVVERHAVMRAIPASAKLFQALHLS